MARGAQRGEAPTVSRSARAAAAAPSTIASVSALIGAYAELSKFGIVVLVLVSSAAGFLLRAPLGPEFPWAQGLVVLIGVLLHVCGVSFNAGAL